MSSVSTNRDTVLIIQTVLWYHIEYTIYIYHTGREHRESDKSF